MHTWNMTKRKPKPSPSEADLDLITTKEAAQILGLSVNTLAMWRYRGRHLAFRRDGRKQSRVRYRRADVLAYLQRNGSSNYEWVYPVDQVA